jgi:hypothetical protein
MSIGLGIFASVVLVLAVYHAGFRTVLLWFSGVVLSLALLSAAVYFAYDRYTTWAAARVEARAKAKLEAAKHDGMVRCMSRLGTPWVAVPAQSVGTDFFNNLQACTIAPDGYDPFAVLGGHIDQGALEQSLPSGYMLDRSGRVVPHIDFSKYAASPCSDNLTLGFVADKPCVLSGRVIQGFRREMCVGTIQLSGDCVTDLPKAAPNGFQHGQYGVQLCPYGLPISADRECPSWKDVDVKKEQEKLLEYRKR